jgi:hypothetical protein
MKRCLLLHIGWVLAAGGLYLPLLLLDVYWNLVRWHPRLDWMGSALLVWVLAAIVAIAWLVRVAQDPVSRGVSLALSVFLVGLGAYACQPEPLTTGLFERESSSPLWYRGARLLIMGLPFIIWLCARRRCPRSA